MIIKKKTDIQEFLYRFSLFAEWDGTKFYLVINDMNRGTTTLMQYPDDSFTIHRKNEMFWDRLETNIEGEQLIKFIWRNRKFINQSLKVTI